MTTRELNDKFVNGVPNLTNEDLDKLLKLYYELAHNADCLDSAFSLYRKELWVRYYMLLGFKEARE